MSWIAQAVIDLQKQGFDDYEIKFRLGINATELERIKVEIEKRK